ncbi:MAG: ATP-binding protein [Desulfocapsa sp.]|jgi:anti-sigma regulatory factor (Ser/Thr protein kinase)|nr:ATP-binding protein [Desulfocapsa sp.]MBN4048940.1 ATP-binding protein [bacterium AH-315-N22]
MIESFKIKGSQQGLEELKSNLERIAFSWKLSKEELFELNLILEEICTNSIMHVKENHRTNEIEITLVREGSLLTMTVTDQNPAFDPTAVKDPDVTSPLHKRKIGGLGLYLVKQYVDHISCTRTGNTNTLIMTKKLNQPDGGKR